MSDTADLMLVVIAVSVAVMALIQIAAVVAGLRAARRLEQVVADLEASVKPLIGSLTALSTDASQTVRLAAAQVERFDRAVVDVTARIEQTLAAAQQLVAGPARNSRALVAGIRAAVHALHAVRESNRRRTVHRSAGFEEEEESLFIG